MLQELLHLANTFDFEEDGSINVAGATWKNGNADLELTLELNTGSDSDNQTWSLYCQSEREHRIVFGWSQNIEVTDAHILLWPHTKTVLSLWFRAYPNRMLNYVE